LIHLSVSELLWLAALSRRARTQHHEYFQVRRAPPHRARCASGRAPTPQRHAKLAAGDCCDALYTMIRLCGDLSHVISILILILRLRVSRSALGVSVKTQELFLLVFLTRYLDLFTTFYSLYNSLMKVAYIMATSYIVCMIKYMEP
jgi:hypothetical protein